ncbi:LysR family transcriptional regulator [Jannaschia ovalis]|uniref:LysR family transcriptional regulator n=1 Tax=Jannaschia ovalis TaxID=3038773 RepID=A0ABY8LEN7_9RHOB|nr:LysR family transcriptional regulator [Jannaschia sp. GRR-S6-38]WGH78628.1 LysR family transcriptional regulator [Jannaschia sp. GRR-S6-38]
MNNRDLLTLRAIARHGSFRDAAERTNQTLSAVSMQMKALEGALGATLFDRATRPPRLTALGRAVAEAAAEVTGAEARLRALAAPEAAPAGRFRLGLTASAGPRLLPGFLRHAAAALPHARFTFHTGLSEGLESAVADGGLDAAIVTATGIPSGALRHRVLARDPLAVARPEGLAPDAPFLQFTPETGLGRVVAAELRDHPELAARPALTLDHIPAILACLDAGLGATILAASDLGDRPSRRLARHRALVLVTRAGGPLDTAGDRLADLLKP